MTTVPAEPDSLGLVSVVDLFNAPPLPDGARPDAAHRGTEQPGPAYTPFAAEGPRPAPGGGARQHRPSATQPGGPPGPRSARSSATFGVSELAAACADEAGPHFPDPGTPGPGRPGSARLSGRPLGGPDFSPPDPSGVLVSAEVVLARPAPATPATDRGARDGDEESDVEVRPPPVLQGCFFSQIGAAAPTNRITKIGLGYTGMLIRKGRAGVGPSPAALAAAPSRPRRCRTNVGSRHGFRCNGRQGGRPIWPQAC